MMMTMVSSNAYIHCVREVAMKGREGGPGRLLSATSGPHVVWPTSYKVSAQTSVSLHTTLASSTYL